MTVLKIAIHIEFNTTFSDRETYIYCEHTVNVKIGLIFDGEESLSDFSKSNDTGTRGYATLRLYPDPSITSTKDIKLGDLDTWWPKKMKDIMIQVSDSFHAKKIFTMFLLC